MRSTCEFVISRLVRGPLGFLGAAASGRFAMLNSPNNVKRPQYGRQCVLFQELFVYVKRF